MLVPYSNEKLFCSRDMKLDLKVELLCIVYAKVLTFKQGDMKEIELFEQSCY